MSIWRTGNPVHKVDKYFITETERDINGRLLITASSVGGYGRLTNIKEIKKLIKNHEINLFVLTTNPQIAVDMAGAVQLIEESYVTDFDRRGVRSTVREIVVFINPSNDELYVEHNGRTISLDQFFE